MDVTPTWLPPGKEAAVCFSVDDVHPGTSAGAYEAGGDLERGALGRIARLLDRHPRLAVTLFVTPDWRPNGLVATRLAARVPGLRRLVHAASVHPKGRMRVDRHPDFVAFLNAMPRTEVAVHGLHHLHPGPRLAVEFQAQDRAECGRKLREALAIFDRGGLRYVRGFAPPAWNLPPPLAEALADCSFELVSSARDLQTPVTADARAAMSGLHGVSLIHPEILPGSRLVHFTTNFQATSPRERAYAVVEHGGLLAVKAHAFKRGGGHTMLDGLDELYCNYLDLLFADLDRRYGDALWWTSMGTIAQRVRAA
jgi:hypothetical protein